MPNGTICTVGHLAKLIASIPKSYVVKIDDDQINILNSNSKVVASINSMYMKLYIKEK